MLLPQEGGIEGSFPKYGDPNMDPNILLGTAKKGTPDFGKLQEIWVAWEYNLDLVHHHPLYKHQSQLCEISGSVSTSVLLPPPVSLPV